MKKVLLIAALLIGTVGMAQEKEKAKLTPEQKIEKKMAKLDEQLDLSDAQVAKLKAIHLDHAKAMEAKKAEMKKLKAEMKEMREAAKKEFDAELTDEQRAKMKELQEARKAKKQENKGKGNKKGPRKNNAPAK